MLENFWRHYDFKCFKPGSVRIDQMVVNFLNLVPVLLLCFMYIQYTYMHKFSLIVSRSAAKYRKDYHCFNSDPELNNLSSSPWVGYNQSS